MKKIKSYDTWVVRLQEEKVKDGGCENCHDSVSPSHE